MKFALIGNSVVLSPSDYLHGLLFERNNVKADYDKVFVDELTRGKYLEINEKYDGFNVTMPYKTRIIPFLSEVKTPFGAVNTVKKGVGFNTDVFGAESALRENFPDLGENVLIMGNGGAARALYFAVKRASKKSVRITFAVRDIAKAEDFSLFRDSETVVYSQIRPCFDYIINATSVGYKNDCILISDEIIAASDGVFDVVYSAKKRISVFRARNSERNTSTEFLCLSVRQPMLRQSGSATIPFRIARNPPATFFRPAESCPKLKISLENSWSEDDLWKLKTALTI